MHAEPFDASTAGVESAIGAPAGMAPDADSGSVTFYGSTTDLYACWAAESYTTAAADTPASTIIKNRIAEPFAYETQIFGDADLSQPGGTKAASELVFDDPKGELDGWLAYKWSGRDITLYRGDHLAAFSTFTVIARLTCDGWGEIDLQKKRLKLRDLGWRLAAAVPLQTFAGTGGIEGSSSEIKDKTKPWTLGSVASVDPLLVDATTLTYQWHHPAIDAASMSPAAVTVRIGGVDWVDGGDYATADALLAATIAAGSFATCDKLGLVRLGSAIPAGENIRIIAQGLTMPGQTPRPAIAIEALLTQTKDIVAHGGAAITLDIVGTDMPSSAVGIHFPAASAPPVIADILNSLTYPPGFYWWQTLTGTLSVRALAAPEAGVPTLEIDLTKPGTIVGEPSITPLVPRKRNVLRANRNEQPSLRAELAGSLTEAEIDSQTRAYREGIGSDEVGIGVAEPSARTYTAETFWRSSAAAGTRAQQLTEIFKVQRYVVRVQVGGIDPFDPPIGEVVDLINWNRFGFGASKQMLCIGAAASAAANSLTLFLWG